MKRGILRFFLLPLGVAAFAVLAWADAPEPGLPAAEQAQRFQRNRGLIQALVDGGLRLAAEEDPLKRADHCNGMAEHLAEEIERAAAQQEGARAAELGQHLHALLEGGVAANLSTAGSHIPIDSPGNQELLRVGNRVARVTRPLEEQLRRTAAGEATEDMQQALHAVANGRAAVEKVLKGRGQPRVREMATSPKR